MTLTQITKHIKQINVQLSIIIPIPALYGYIFIKMDHDFPSNSFY